MKYIAIFLLLANLAYFGWSASRFAEPIVVASPAPRPLLNNGMTLLEEYQAERESLRLAALEASKICLRVGVFNTVDDGNAFLSRAAEAGLSGQLRFEGELLPPQYRVFLPPASSRAIAAIVLDGLGEKAEAAGLRLETYLVTRGSLENAIALGVFESPEQAASIEEQVTELGYQPEVGEVVRSAGGISVRLESARSLSLQSPEWLDLADESQDLLAVENLCETIAQGEQFP
jgi:hypothetical protein